MSEKSRIRDVEPVVCDAILKALAPVMMQLQGLVNMLSPIPIKRKPFNLWTAVNEEYFSVGQRKLLLVFLNQVAEMDTTDSSISNLDCGEIRAVIRLFGEYLALKMIC